MVLVKFKKSYIGFPFKFWNWGCFICKGFNLNQFLAYPWEKPLIQFCARWNTKLHFLWEQDCLLAGNDFGVGIEGRSKNVSLPARWQVLTPADHDLVKGMGWREISARPKKCSYWFCGTKLENFYFQNKPSFWNWHHYMCFIVWFAMSTENSLIHFWMGLSQVIATVVRLLIILSWWWCSSIYTVGIFAHHVAHF